ncbi:WD40 repeat-like protein [Gigaspora margarita]|uniref:WD40 repeat-like protein n=1 Tax=Gigaspora margarita TaxID=4874 RepID=A0A8H4AD66_GIGMA|nr:WD40 repeat-like protein [Gigaspora margarita]
MDVPPRHIRKAISQTSSPSMSPTSPQLSPMPPLTIPLSSMINLMPTGVSYGVTLDAEVATFYSVTTDDQKLESLDIEDPIPLRDSPDFAIKGQHGLIKCTILNNRQHIITLDNSGECIRVKTFGKRDFNEVVQKVNTIEYIPIWCEVDTRIGALTVHLDERTCFDAEAYADELDLLESADIREDQRINLGKWVLRNLFANFTRTLIEIYEELQAQNLLRPQRLPNDYRRELQDDRSLPLQHISFPPAIHKMLILLLPTTSTLPQSPNTETKPESSGTSVSTENNADAKTDSKPSAPTQSQDESSAQVRKDDESKDLKPHEGSELEELPNGNSRLTANRMLRARKILSYIVEKLELDSPGGGERDEIVTEKTLIEKYEEKTKNSIKPEMLLELVCLDQILPPTMTLATINHIYGSKMEI